MNSSHSFHSLLPSSISDNTFKSLEEIFSRMEKIKPDNYLSMAVFHNEDTKEDMLDLLLKQFRMEEFAKWFRNDLKEKKVLIKNAVAYHRYKGTTWGICSILKELGVSATIREWYEYQGEPGNFILSVNLDESSVDLNSDIFLRIKKVIHLLKNMRSTLEYIEVTSSSQKNIEVIENISSDIMLTSEFEFPELKTDITVQLSSVAASAITQVSTMSQKIQIDMSQESVLKKQLLKTNRGEKYGRR